MNEKGLEQSIGLNDFREPEIKKHFGKSLEIQLVNKINTMSEKRVLVEPPTEQLKPQDLKTVVDKAIETTTPEAEKVPPWFRQIVKKIADAWFDPKSFEQNPKVYEKLGIRTFKKYIPTGDLMNRLVWKRLGAEDLVKPTLESLKNYEKYTRLYESVHLTALGLGAVTMAAQLSSGQIEGAVFTAGINTLVNVYPILLQRYNRSRLYKVINRMESREKNITRTPIINENDHLKI